jgi:CDP-diacylglycerol---glycerol-3-phosphate 3-phosphatidyltransferase
VNFPNQLTLARLVLTVIFVVVTACPESWGKGWCYSVGLFIFAIASITDWLDGYWARKYQLETAFGKLMDPLVDKVLMCAAFVILTEVPALPPRLGGLLPGWFTVGVLAREFLVTGLRLIASAKGHVMAADRLGKHKTTWQIILACYMLCFLASRETAFSFLSPLFQAPWFSPTLLGPVLVWLALGITLWSGWVYFWKNRSLVVGDW